MLSSKTAKIIKADNINKTSNYGIFKDNISTFINKTDDSIPEEIIQIAKYVSDNPTIIKTIIDTPTPFRCFACCFNKKQCTKNKKKNSLFCGIHMKGTPYGVVVPKNNNIINIDITLTEINGVLCFIDHYGNIYQAEDIIQHKLNPKIIAHMINGIYTPC
jgi:hypothetical protein